MKRSLSFQIPIFVIIRTVLNTAIRMVYPFLPVFGRGLDVDLGMLSLALALRSASGILGPFLASIADSRGRKTGMLFGLILFTVGMSLIVIRPTYPAFTLMLILTITGNFVFIPSMQAYIGDRVPYRRRGRALALTEFGWSLSFIIGVPLAGLLIARYGWQTPFPILACLGGLSLAFLFILLPQDQVADSNRPGLWRNLLTIVTYSPAVAGILFGLAISASNELFSLIFGVWMEDSFGVKIALLAAASAVIGFSELGGEALVTILSDNLGKSRAVSIGLILNGLAALVLPVLGRNLTGALLGLLLLYITFEFTLVSSIPLMSEVLPAARATLMATYIASMAIGRSLGDFIAPILYEPTSGVLALTLAAAGLNLVALVALRFLRIPQKV